MKKNTRLLVGCARLDRDPAHSAHGFGQQVASLVLWFGFDDWVIDQINTEATRTPMPSPHLRNLVRATTVASLSHYATTLVEP